MKEELLRILICPKCKKDKWFLKKNQVNAVEIVSGELLCDDCGTHFEIRDGIVDFLYEPNESVSRERKAMDEEEYITDERGNKYKINDETIEKFKDKFLVLPEGDGSYMFKRGGSFQTFAEASDRFYSSLYSMCLTGNEKILELGAAFGSFSLKFAKKGCSVVALDISNYLKVSSLFIEDAYFDRIFSDMHDIPFKEGSFDIVFGAAVLHHSKDLGLAFREIHRVLKKGGRFVLINEVSRGIFEKIHPVFEKVQSKGYGDTAYTIPEWKRGAREGGFKKTRLEFLSLADDYITRHKNRDTPLNFKLKLAYFFVKHRKIEKILLSTFVWQRVLFRPKSWRLIGYK